jgi:hypothetical protein
MPSEKKIRRYFDDLVSTLESEPEGAHDLLAAAFGTIRLVPLAGSYRLSGIPVMHRGLASAFLVVSGHAEEAFGPSLGSLEPGAATIVVLMGLQTRTATAG